MGSLGIVQEPRGRCRTGCVPGAYHLLKRSLTGGAADSDARSPAAQGGLALPDAPRTPRGGPRAVGRPLATPDPVTRNQPRRTRTDQPFHGDSARECCGVASSGTPGPFTHLVAGQRRARWASPPPVARRRESGPPTGSRRDGGQSYRPPSGSRNRGNTCRSAARRSRRQIPARRSRSAGHPEPRPSGGRRSSGPADRHPPGASVAPSVTLNTTSVGSSKRPGSILRDPTPPAPRRELAGQPARPAPDGPRIITVTAAPSQARAQASRSTLSSCSRPTKGPGGGRRAGGTAGPASVASSEASWARMRA